MNPETSLFAATDAEPSLSSAKTSGPTFEEALVDLDRVVRTLEAGETGLEEAIAQYEKGVHLLKHCFGQLRKVEMRISELTGLDETGKPTLRPFEHAASVEVKAEKKPRRAKESP